METGEYGRHSNDTLSLAIRQRWLNGNLACWPFAADCWMSLAIRQRWLNGNGLVELATNAVYPSLAIRQRWLNGNWVRPALVCAVLVVGHSSAMAEWKRVNVCCVVSNIKNVVGHSSAMAEWKLGRRIGCGSLLLVVGHSSAMAEWKRDDG